MEGFDNGGSMVHQRTEYPVNPIVPDTGINQNPSTDESLNMTEEVIFLEPGQEKAQNIVKAMSHQNAGEVVQLLSTEGPLRLSDIAERLNISLNAAKYHIENLMTAGILEISNTKYSVKGKKVKIYRLKNQVFIVAPRMNSIAQVRSALMKYSAALLIFVGVFCVVSVQGIVTLPTVRVDRFASFHLGTSEAMLVDSTVIPALIIAATVTMLLLVGYELHTNWKNRKSPI
ncbi:MAG: helix-turn-helix domain-containing protein [Methanoregula sp.]